MNILAIYFYISKSLINIKFRYINLLFFLHKYLLAGIVKNIEMENSCNETLINCCEVININKLKSVTYGNQKLVSCNKYLHILDNEM